MQIQSVLVLSVEEAREGLAQWYAEQISFCVINAKSNLVECIRDNTFNRWVPNLKDLSALKIAELYGELNVGEKLGIKHKATQVVVETQPGWSWQLVWDIKNVDPQRRAEIQDLPNPDVVANFIGERL